MAGTRIADAPRQRYGDNRENPMNAVATLRAPPTDELKLNIGCGLSGIAGWCNIDNSPTVLLSRIPMGRRLFGTPVWPRDVRRINVLRGLPFRDESVSYIYSSH